jgi:lipoprotein-anchoring transpeptidase ErfK/SrfK
VSPAGAPANPSGGNPPATASASATLPTAPPAAPATATTVPAPVAPSQLTQATLAGQPLPAGGWTVGGVVLTIGGPAAGADSLVPEVALAPADQPFPVSPTASGPAVAPSGGNVVGQIQLKDVPPGPYQWEARFRDPTTTKVSPWSPVGAAGGFEIAGSPPTLANLSVSGAHQAGTGAISIGAADQPVLHWTDGATPAAALDHVVYLADHQASAASQPPANGQSVAAASTSLDLANLADGQWDLHLWAVDKAGQVSAPASLPVLVAKAAPQVSNVIFRSWVTNPLYQTASIRFDVSEPVSATVIIMPITTTDALRTYEASGSQISLSWDGKDSQGKIVPNGSYRFLINATDPAGNLTQTVYSGLQITDKVIRVSLGTESLTALTGSQAILHTLVTSGGQRLPTPTGTFEIQEKTAPFVFHSPYPKGSPYWYPDTPSNAVMLFDPTGANFIHDAPWRTIFGPGTNGPGIPGDTYDGSHGCVELPTAAMRQLYAWTPLGTPVVITN